MIRYLFLIFLLVPSIMSAQVIAVRSGEHGDFTRLVFRIPVGSEWVVEPSEAGGPVKLVITGNAVSFDTSRTFQRIDRTRISGMEQAGEGQLRIDLACKCQVNSFVTDGNLLVLDVSAAPAGTTVAAESTQLVQPASPTAAHSDTQNPLVNDLARVRLDGSPGVGPRKTPDPLLPRLPDRPLEAGSGRTYGTEAAPEADVAEAPFVLGDQIAADLAAAATAGLLDPAIREQIKPIQVSASAHSDGGEQPYSPDNSEVAQELAAGLSAAANSGLKGGRVSVGGDGCVKDSRLALASWIDADTDINVALADSRSEIFGEFDRVNEKALYRYARALLHFGFGAEARALMKLGSEKPDSTLLALSFLVDGVPDPTGRFRDQSSCEGSAAMWAVLSDAHATSSDTVDHNAVLRGFEALPSHLMEFLGPILAERMSEAGYTNSGRDILRRLALRQGEESQSVALGRAQIDLATGDLEAATVRLKPLSELGSPQTPEAIIARVAVADAKNEALPERIVDLAGAFANEMRNSEQGIKLWRAHVRSLLLNGAFEQAFDVLANAEGIPEETISQANDAALADLTTKAEDLTFLKLVIPPRPQRSGGVVKETTMLDIAQRLVRLGMSDAALDYVAQISSPTDERRGRLIKAEAYLDMERPEEAEINLIGLKGADVVKLRAEARRQMGDYVLAEEIYKEIGQDADAATSAWLSGDWAGVANRSDGVLSEAAQLIQQEQASVNPLNPTLQDAEQLTEQSASSLETIRSLLEATRIADAN